MVEIRKSEQNGQDILVAYQAYTYKKKNESSSSEDVEDLELRKDPKLHDNSRDRKMVKCGSEHTGDVRRILRTRFIKKPRSIVDQRGFTDHHIVLGSY